MTIEWKSTLKENTDNVDAKSIKDLDAAELKDHPNLKSIQTPQSKEKKDVICEEARLAEQAYIMYGRGGEYRRGDVILGGLIMGSNHDMAILNNLAHSTKDWLNGLIYIFNKYKTAEMKSNLKDALKKNQFTKTLDIELLPISVLNVLANYSSAALQKAITSTANSGNERDAEEILEVISTNFKPLEPMIYRDNAIKILKSISKWPLENVNSKWLEIDATSGNLDALEALGILSYYWNIAAKEALSNLYIDNLLNTIFSTRSTNYIQFLYETTNSDIVVNKLKNLIEKYGNFEALDCLISLNRTPNILDVLKTFNSENLIKALEDGKWGRDEYERLWLLNAYDPPICPATAEALKKLNIEKIKKLAEQGNLNSIGLIISIIDDNEKKEYMKNAIVSTLDPEALGRFADYGNEIARSKLRTLANIGDPKAIELSKRYDKTKSQITNN